MGPAFERRRERIRARRPSRSSIRAPPAVAVSARSARTCRSRNRARTLVGTGPFIGRQRRTRRREMRANDDYYLGQARRSTGSSSQAYPSVRAAWAEMLRGQLDMLYEVGADALDSLRGVEQRSRRSRFARRYQYAVILNTQSPTLLPLEAFRRALNQAIDRDAIVRDALERPRRRRRPGPVWPHHWALQPALAAVQLRHATRPAELLSRAATADDVASRVSCRPDAAASSASRLIVKRQLAAGRRRHGRSRKLPSISIAAAFASRRLRGRPDRRDQRAERCFRPYRLVALAGGVNLGYSSSAAVDAALDQRPARGHRRRLPRAASRHSSRPSSTTRRRSSSPGASARARSASASPCRRSSPAATS